MSHFWLRGGRRADRAARLAGLELPPQLLDVVDAHRNLRGPYTAGGTIVRALTQGVLASRPELARQHDIELLSVAPELRTVLPHSRETLTSMALPKERTRFYARMRTVRIAHGLVEYLRDGAPDGHWTVVIENLDHAEPTDLEFVTAALRRLSPERITLVLCSAGAIADEALAVALERYAVPITVPAGGAASAEGAVPTGAAASADEAVPDAAWQYVASDCTSDDPAWRAAYASLADVDRAALHDRRAAELAERDEFSLVLGAISYHREHGSDPTGTGVETLYQAQDHCLCLGFYEAVVDYAQRGLRLIDGREREGMWWAVAIELGLAWSILGRTHEAMDLYNQARLLSVRPEIHMAAAYSTAMLYTRHNDPAERDEKLAKSWLHSAIATASLLPDRVERAFQSAFYKNGLALVEVNLGDLSEALRLVDECIASLDEKLTPDEHRLHRAVLKNNRARVYLGLGRLTEALADYAVVIAEDPNHCEHYLERGNILRRLGRYDEAAADYARAIALTPPFPEIHYNRGDLLLSLDDVEGALAEFSYVLELDPSNVDAYINRAGIHLGAEEYEAAEADAIAGLQFEPDNAHLHVVLGEVRYARGDLAGARQSYDAALAASPELVSALSGRATLAYDLGELEQALADLTAAVTAAPDDPALRYNRGFLHLEAGRWDEALADLDLAAELTPDDEAVQEARASCLARMAAA